MSSSSSRERNIAILGGGVLGLTTALELASSHPTTPSTPRLNIHILGRDLASSPESLLSQQWASPWAGFNWCSFATKDDTVTQSRDRLAYMEWKRIVETGELPASTMARMPFVQYLPEGVGVDDIWFKDFVDDFEYHSHSSPSDPRPCIKYTSFGVNTPLYLAYLIERLRSFDYVDGSRVSISFHQTGTFESLAEAYAYCRKEFAPPTAGASSSSDDSWLLVNATGLGSLTLLDVLDKQVYPIRGQTVLLRVPPAFTNAPRCVMDVITPPAYLIPRGAGSGQVILGGTFGNDEWDTRVSEEDTVRILRECWRLCPDILDGTAGSGEEAVEMLRKQIISVNVGLRPARRGDVARVELDAIKVGGGDGGERVPVLHCYGAGKAGYQSSLGIAKEARKLVEAHYRELEG